MDKKDVDPAGVRGPLLNEGGPEGEEMSILGPRDEFTKEKPHEITENDKELAKIEDAKKKLSK